MRLAVSYDRRQTLVPMFVFFFNGVAAKKNESFSKSYTKAHSEADV
jgi:hypothetical protein